MKHSASYLNAFKSAFESPISQKYRYTQFIGETVFDTTGGYNLYTSGRLKTDLTRPIRENWRRRSNRREREGEKERTIQ